MNEDKRTLQEMIAVIDYETAKNYHEHKAKSNATMEMRLLHPDSLIYFDKSLDKASKKEVKLKVIEKQIEDIDNKISMLNTCLTGTDKSLDNKIRSCIRQFEHYKNLKEFK